MSIAGFRRSGVKHQNRREVCTYLYQIGLVSNVSSVGCVISLAAQDGGYVGGIRLDNVVETGVAVCLVQ